MKKVCISLVFIYRNSKYRIRKHFEVFTLYLRYQDPAVP